MTTRAAIWSWPARLPTWRRASAQPALSVPTTIWTSTLATILATALLAAVACSLIPDDEYLRYQLLDQSDQRGVRWVYERTHFDDKAIDVAIVGASRTGAGIDAAQLERRFASSGARETVVNFSIPQEGRDLHWLIAEQVLRLKHPKVMIVGVIEQPSRAGSPGYKFIAPSSEIVNPAYLGNRNYFSNLIYLPYRQLYLLFAQAFPRSAGMHMGFDAGHAMSGPGIQFHGQHADLPKAELQRRSFIFRHRIKAPRFAERYADIEFGDERSYIRRISKLAARTKTQLVFLYMPYFDGPQNVVQPRFYRQHGRLLTAGFLTSHDEFYNNLAHLNKRGATVLTDWLGSTIEPLLHDGR